jgi:uncharacterized protein YdeI (YjbR/CyaY-like superfamily)
VQRHLQSIFDNRPLEDAFVGFGDAVAIRDFWSINAWNEHGARLPARLIASRRRGRNADSAGTLCGVNTEVETYIDQSEQWPEEMAALRPILLSCGLAEHIKWGKPCFGHEGKNIVIFQEMKNFLALMFFKGALLSDRAGVLVEQGPNSRSARRIEFRSAADVDRLAATVAAYVQEAIEVEQAGLKVDPAPGLVLIEELQNRLDADPALGSAFKSLTPGRQREYNLYFSSAKQPKTRTARVEKYAPKILEGKGFRDR